MPHAPEKKLWSKNFLALIASNLLLCLGVYMLPATLPAHVAGMGGTPLQTGLVIGAFSIFSMLTRVASGIVIDVAGEKRIIWIGMVTIALSTLLMVWMPVNGILFMRCLQGIGWGLATASIATVVYKIVPEAQRGEGAGYYSLTVIVPVSLSPLLAIVLMEDFEFEMVLAVSALLTFAALVSLKQGLSTLAHRHPQARSSGAAMMMRVFEPGALLPSFLCFILSVPLCGVMAYIVLFGREQQVANIWVFFIGYAVMILATRSFVGRLFDARGHAAIILPGSTAMLLGLVALSQTRSVAMLVVSSLLFGLGYGAVQPSLQTWAVNRCPPHRKAAANGLFMSAIDLGYIVGSVTLGQIAQSLGFASMYLFSAGIMVLFMLAYWMSTRSSHSS
jgi:MFS family permease